MNGRIYAIGGQSDTATYLDSVEEYDPPANTWVVKTSMPTARRYLAASVVNSRIYAIGGQDTANAYPNAVEEFDPGLRTLYIHKKD